MAGDAGRVNVAARIHVGFGFARVYVNPGIPSRLGRVAVAAEISAITVQGERPGSNPWWLDEQGYTDRRSLLFRRRWTVPTGVRVFERIPPGVEEAVVVGDRGRVRDEGVRAEEGSQLWVIVAGVEVEQAGGACLRGVLYDLNGHVFRLTFSHSSESPFVRG